MSVSSKVNRIESNRKPKSTCVSESTRCNELGLSIVMNKWAYNQAHTHTHTCTHSNTCVYLQSMCVFVQLICHFRFSKVMKNVLLPLRKWKSPRNPVTDPLPFLSSATNPFVQVVSSVHCSMLAIANQQLKG